MSAKHFNDDLVPPTFLVRIAQREDGCWQWIGASDRYGYGLFAYERRRRLAHRFAYQLFIGPIPKGLEIDHLCRNRLCVNPLHMEAVTHLENMLRSPRYQRVGTGYATGTICANGHELTPENTAISGRKRWCRICNRAYQRGLYQRRKAAGAEAA